MSSYFLQGKNFFTLFLYIGVFTHVLIVRISIIIQHISVVWSQLSFKTYKFSCDVNVLQMCNDKSNIMTVE